MSAYYNERDPKAAAWIRELIKAGLITDGEVDERSIEDVLPKDVIGFARCHFFAGIAVWDYALNQAGYDRWDTVTWTGSCPCQPFSQAGKREGFADERHLWPAWFHLIQQCRPDIVFGEQVESKDGRAWLDLVQDDMEASAYAFGALGLCAAGFGAPHIRARIFFVADSARNNELGIRQSGARNGRRELPIGGHGSVSGLADPTGQRYDGRRAGETSGRTGESERSRDASRVGDTEGGRFGINGSASGNAGYADQPDAIGELGNASGQGLQERISDGRIQSTEMGSSERQALVSRGATNGFWADAEWLYCRDEKWRAAKPGTPVLAHGIANRVVKLRGFGNSIVAPVAEEFIKAYMEAERQ